MSKPLDDDERQAAEQLCESIDDSLEIYGWWGSSLRWLRNNYTRLREDTGAKDTGRLDAARRIIRRLLEETDE